MANYANSLLVTAQGLLADKYANTEMRHKAWNITRLMLAGSNAIVPQTVEQLKTSDQVTVEAYCMTKSASDAITARAHNHSASAFGDSQVVQLSWATKGQEFKTSIKIADRNFLNAAQILANRMESAWIHLLDTIEAANAAYLASYKSQVQSATDNADEWGSWDSSNYIWKVESSRRNYFFQYVRSMMVANNYNDMLDFVADPIAFAIASQLAAQGPANGTNTSFQFGDTNVIMAVDLTPASGYAGWGYVIPAGTVGMLQWIPTVNRNGLVTRSQTYSNMSDPFGIGIVGAVNIQETLGSTYSTGGELQDEVIEYELTVDIANVKAPLSTSNESTIFKVGLVSGEGA